VPLASETSKNRGLQLIRLWRTKAIALDIAWWVRTLFPENVGNWMLPKKRGKKVGMFVEEAGQERQESGKKKGRYRTGTIIDVIEKIDNVRNIKNGWSFSSMSRSAPVEYEVEIDDDVRDEKPTGETRTIALAPSELIRRCIFLNYDIAWVIEIFPEKVRNWMLPKTEGSKVRTMMIDGACRTGTIIEIIEIPETITSLSGSDVEIVHKVECVVEIDEDARKEPKGETRRFTGDDLLRICVFESEGGSKVGFTEWTLYSTVAVSVLDALDASATLAYEPPDESQYGPSGLAYVSALASMFAGCYGIFGEIIWSFVFCC
jgi:hypothetical protein